MIRWFFIITIGYSILLLCSCNKQEQYGFDENDTIRGIWGQTILYDEFGFAVTNNEGIQIIAHCVDTLGNNTNGDFIVFDTTLTTITDSKGFWQFNKAPGGLYFIECIKEGFCKNTVYNYSYDTLRADTLDVLYLSVKPQAEVSLDSISLQSTMLNLSRTVSFNSSQSAQYMLSTWYFFDTSSQVSASKYVYAYMSGAAVGKGGDQQSLTTKKPLDKLYESGITEGKTVYVSCAVDNAKYVQYYNEQGLVVYPNISQLSTVKSFVMPVED
ncbi:MAG: hypothetical protein BWY22_00569 [Bacteroidetes bacterium ADurb.Bin217]|nr:MAG: hypothetical protein BWY22_00569 [Bacteroidetes bacterium ADurb.Bin217]